MFTEEQAKRGHVVFADECARCHSVDLMGNDDTPALAGEAFLSKWDGRTAGDLFDRIRSSMPDDNPGQLSNQQYADVLAHILSENEFPAGRQELAHKTAPLKQIRIDAKRP